MSKSLDDLRRQANQLKDDFNAGAIKTRAVPFREFVLGKSHEGSSNLFIHAEVRILEGRTGEQKEALISG